MKFYGTTIKSPVKVEIKKISRESIKRGNLAAFTQLISEECGQFDLMPLSDAAYLQ